MKLSKNDYLVSSFFFSGFVLFASLLYLDYNKNLSASGLRPLGKVIYKKHEVKRKYSDRLVWENINQSSVVYSYDSILTGEDSDAKLKLENGLELELKPNSMIELNFSGNDTKIKLKSGNIKAKNSGESIATLETANGAQIQMSNAEASIAGGKESSSIQVESGNISLVTKDNKKLDIAKGEKADFSESGVKKEKITISLTSPLDGYTIYTDAINTQINFSWASDEKKNSSYLLEISSSPSFTSKNIQRTISGTSTSLSLSSGTWYWRIRSLNTNDTSPYRRVSLSYATHPIIYYPDNNRMIEMNQNQKFINFRWENKKDFNLYSIKLDNNSDFSSPIASLKTSNNSWRYENLKPGTYYFSVEALSNNPLTKMNSSPSVSRFTVSELKNYKLPYAYTNQKTPFTMIEVKNSRAILKWENTSALQYTATIYNPNDRNKIISQKNLTSPYYVLPKSLSTGTYPWTLAADYGNGNIIRSKTLYFRIKKNEPIELFSLADQYKIISPNDKNIVQLKFRWQNESGSVYYRFLIAEDSRFQKIERNEKITNPDFTLIKIKPGTYYWKVEAYSELDRLNQSVVRSFKVLSSLSEIKQIYPLPEKKKIEIGQKDHLYFKWDKIEGATHYEFKLYQKQNGKNHLIKSAVITTNYFYFYELTLLKEEKIRWQVTPIIKKNNKVLTKGKTKDSEFKVDYGKLPEPPKFDINPFQ